METTPEEGEAANARLDSQRKKRRERPPKRNRLGKPAFKNPMIFRTP